MAGIFFISRMESKIEGPTPGELWRWFLAIKIRTKWGFHGDFMGIS
jgi:hypothetical protein